MSVPRWNPPVELLQHELPILKLVKRNRKLFGFLRKYRHLILDDGFQAELAAMYRDTGAGEQANAPALMCMVTLLQCFSNTSDAETVALSMADSRWRLVLDSLETTGPLFSQGALQQFRERLIANDMDRRLLERTVEVAREVQELGIQQQATKKLRIGIDSRPLQGAGRVEDTFNLLGHAARKLVACIAKATKMGKEAICKEAKCPLFLASSVKAGLDVDWSDGEQKREAINRLADEVSSLVTWMEQTVCDAAIDDRGQFYLKALAQVEEQDLERLPDGTVKIREGVAADRRISIEDPDMRHGRKSKKKPFNGYKEHIASDLDNRLIVACTVTPANVPEREAADVLKADIESQGLEIGELFIDRGYAKSDAVEEVERAGGEVLCKPWRIIPKKPELFSKADFHINIRDRTITCPAGQIEHFEFGKSVEFDPTACKLCPQRNQCTERPLGRGRTVNIADDEARQKRWRKNLASKKGRQRLRIRTGVEHQLAHNSARKGPRARYRGTRKNLFDLRRTSAIGNLETVQRKIAA